MAAGEPAWEAVIGLETHVQLRQKQDLHVGIHLVWRRPQHPYRSGCLWTARDAAGAESKGARIRREGGDGSESQHR